VERCTDPHTLNYTTWSTLPGILVLLVSEDGMIEGSAGDALQVRLLYTMTNCLPFMFRFASKTVTISVQVLYLALLVNFW